MGKNTDPLWNETQTAETINRQAERLQQAQLTEQTLSKQVDELKAHNVALIRENTRLAAQLARADRIIDWMLDR